MLDRIQHELYAELMKAIAVVIRNHHIGKDGTFHHYYMNPMEGACVILAKMKGVWFLNKSDEQIFQCSPYVYVDDPENIKCNVMENSGFTFLDLETGICKFLEFADHHDLPVLKRSMFEFPKEFFELFKAFAQAGFGRIEGAQYKWNDVIAPFMWSEFIWNENDPDEAAKINAYIDEMLAHWPSYLEPMIAAEIEAALKKQNIDVSKLENVSAVFKKDQISERVILDCIARVIRCCAPNGRWLEEGELSEVFSQRVFEPLTTLISDKIIRNQRFFRLKRIANEA